MGRLFSTGRIFGVSATVSPYSVDIDLLQISIQQISV